MQKSAGLLADLGDCFDAIKAHLATMESARLSELSQVLPSSPPANSAQMTMLLLLHQEITARRGHSNHTCSDNVVDLSKAFRSLHESA